MGSKRIKTSEGFMLCKDVVFARTGEMIYGAGEIPVKPGPDGVARVTRDASVVFSPKTLESAIGKSATVRHPPTVVGTHDWRTVEAGTILNARRGEGAMSEFMIGDVIVKDKATIDMLDDAANRGQKVEVSLGYDAKYADDGNGRGRQVTIDINHLAFLPPGIRGRCGPECFTPDEEGCYIGDQAMDVEEPKMTTKNFGADLLRKVLGAKDETDVTRVLDQMTQDEALATRDEQIATLTKTVEALAASVAKLTKDAEAKEEDDADEDDEKKDTMDAATVQALATRTAAQAEILSPGYKIPTFDAKGDLVATVDHLCTCQRDALVKAYATDAGKKVIENIIGPSPDFAKMTADAVGSTFFGASALMAALNNSSIAALAGVGDPNPMRSQYEITADADRRSQEKWAKRRAGQTA